MCITVHCSYSAHTLLETKSSLHPSKNEMVNYDKHIHFSIRFPVHSLANKATTVLSGTASSWVAVLLFVHGPYRLRSRSISIINSILLISMLSTFYMTVKILCQKLFGFTNDSEFVLALKWSDIRHLMMWYNHPLLSGQFLKLGPYYKPFILTLICVHIHKKHNYSARSVHKKHSIHVNMRGNIVQKPTFPLTIKNSKYGKLLFNQKTRSEIVHCCVKRCSGTHMDKLRI